ncbi:acyl-CoA thioesterase [Halorubrum sp. JWXQ-INN 858]|uniref:acyl-CoA thioesterase n=1 Tax=Halorubrum sp. JWXQ-INN 858 TaxID=2690782 RepID=UPI001358E571|nr:thioesterase family protein [Halorubrum sp. JWXQ-INN 858]MWV64116.1 acyl-CoA thioesterase [Halorubrum sp. JWXQ-INN 858]
MTEYAAEIEVRFRDIDSMGHVNNAVYATYTEQARTRYARDVLDTDLSSIPTVLAALSIEYRRPVELEAGSVTAAIDVPEIGTSSLPMTYEIRTDEGVAAEAESTQVFLDESTGRPMPIPEAYRSAIVDYHDL